MKITIDVVIKEPPCVYAANIDAGTVFTGMLIFCSPAGTPITGTFLRVHSHIVDVGTNHIYGCGQAGSASEFRVYKVKDFKAYPGSELLVKERQECEG